jgi:hypothetical protein
MLISKSRAAKKNGGGGDLKGFFCVARACPNESYSRARAAVDATPPPAAAALCFHHRRHLRIFSRCHCSRPPPSPLPTPLKLRGPPTGLTSASNRGGSCPVYNYRHRHRYLAVCIGYFCSVRAALRCILSAGSTSLPLAFTASLRASKKRAPATVP